MMRQQRRSLFVQTQATPNPNSLKFLVPKDHAPLLESGQALSFTRSGYKEAQKSPLAAKLMQLDDVGGVFIGEDFVTVTISEEADWKLTKPEVFAVLTDFLASGQSVLADAAEHADTAIEEDDDEVVSMIKEILETRIRPILQEDGGDVRFHAFNHETGIVQLELLGACDGCPSAGVTFHSAIENMLMHYIPEVDGIEEYKDPEIERVSQEQLEKLEQGLEAIRKNKNTSSTKQ
eukprot:TRINITY_DN61466_c0_g1_i1.p2 TRINITY_DN61466_c0_g1~~TRINITY_DN61466_c0_g1_i1.p2  ORF type:complete len:234 (+),score=132.79 TRINITY_DN61466_c0_g1_i1:103-804(+)